MFEILTVCTGNICRSPLAEQLLRTRLAPLAPRVHSAGTRGLARRADDPRGRRARGRISAFRPEDAASHRSRYLTEATCCRAPTSSSR